MAKMLLSAISAKMVSSEELVPQDKPKVPAGIDTDGNVFQITLPLRVKESDITISEGVKQDKTKYNKANVCFKFAAKDLTLAVEMEDGTTRYYRVKNNAGPYGADRYISLGFDPEVFFTRPADTTAEVEQAEVHTPEAMEAEHS